MNIKEYAALQILFHPSIPISQKKMEKRVKKGLTIGQALIETLKENEEAFNYLVKNEKIRPGFLILNNKIELKTTGKLESKIEGDLTIRIIPISHGG
ncbi:MAG: hypothetical protein K9W46_10025 [Candidatus Heimdallarchaeum endolithica]|uniref:MoaD/ThiS family protein n=1 Tax=Candidatus Heimdallarchaeum endolithica TaxID=2876572 RepID=A0A9Y1FN37_9ARCH|nr:MAG: hypothetical protein K9W46_10025 [Candidatus Heimdallarchaeum endolithica]